MWLSRGRVPRYREQQVQRLSGGRTVGECKEQQEGWSRNNEEESDFKVTYLISSLPRFPKVGVINHSFTAEDTEAETN